MAVKKKRVAKKRAAPKKRVAKKRVAKKKTKRNYAKERAYDSKPEVKKRRAMRNRARYKMIKAGKSKVGDGKDVDHVTEIHAGGSNDISNLKSVNASKNRSYKRDKNARRKK